MQFHKRWRLGFLGLIGIYEMPDALAVFNGEGGLSSISLTWLIWLLYFVPAKQHSDPRD